MNIKTGIGYDIHCLVEGRNLFLGGVKIDYEKGLEGHSDADVLIHAICDAILGALGQGDIGEHFPNTDKKYLNISSLILLDRVKEILDSEGYLINNVDTIIQAQEPNIKKYKVQMKKNIADVLKLSEGSINIKATTLEKLDSIGNKEGIAAFATVILTKK